MDVIKTLNKLNSAFGPSGNEGDVRDIIKQIAEPYADEFITDVMGNLICHRKGSGPRVMFAAHMDSIGFIVTHIEENGYLRFGRVGAIHPENVLYVPVRFRNGTVGTVCLDQGVAYDKMTLDDMYIDIGASSREEAETCVSPGDMAIYDVPNLKTFDKVKGAYLDNRICCVALLSAMAGIKKTNNDLYFVFTVQEEVGLRGAKPSTFAIDPDYGIVCDVTAAGDVLGSKYSGSASLGGGAAIKVMDASVICHPHVVKLLKELAAKKKIPFQIDVLKQGGTDGGSMHPTKNGVYTGGISVPTRYIHSPGETADLRDVENVSKLLAAFAETKLEVKL